MPVDVDRRTVLAYRVLRSGLTRETKTATKLAVLDLGVQDTPSGSAAIALAARLPGAISTDELTMIWTHRGAPHLHRPEDVKPLASALWPLGDADAETRMTAAGAAVQRAGVGGLDALTQAARTMRAVVTKPTPRGEVSTAVTQRLPDSLSSLCPSCGARHVYDQLFRLAALPAGLRIDPDVTPLTFVPITPWPGPPKKADPAGVLETYLRLLGPASPADVASFMATSPAELKRAWPKDLAEVRVDGKTKWIPEDSVDALRKAKPAKLVRLLAPGDPFLQARDRALLLPDKQKEKALWRNLGRVGAVLVDAEIAGLWQMRASGKKLSVTVTPFGVPPKKAIEQEAERVASTRGASTVSVAYA